jgi:hypothetical protein
VERNDELLFLSLLLILLYILFICKARKVRFRSRANFVNVASRV